MAEAKVETQTVVRLTLTEQEAKDLHTLLYKGVHTNLFNDKFYAIHNALSKAGVRVGSEAYTQVAKAH